MHKQHISRCVYDNYSFTGVQQIHVQNLFNTNVVSHGCTYHLRQAGLCCHHFVKMYVCTVYVHIHNDRVFYVHFLVTNRRISKNDGILLSFYL